MAADDNAEVPAKIDRLETTLTESVASLRQEHEVAASLRGEYSDPRECIAEFRGEVRRRLDGMSQCITDVNARLPVPIAYSPPGKPAAE